MNELEAVMAPDHPLAAKARVGILRIAKRTISPAADIFLAALREAARESASGPTRVTRFRRRGREFR